MNDFKNYSLAELQKIKTELEELLKIYNGDYKKAIEDRDPRAEKKAAVLASGVEKDINEIAAEIVLIERDRQNIDELLKRLEAIKKMEAENEKKYKENIKKTGSPEEIAELNREEMVLVREGSLMIKEIEELEARIKRTGFYEGGITPKQPGAEEN